MNRTGLIVALIIAAGAGLILGLFPEIELSIARVFYYAIDADDNLFTLGQLPIVVTSRKLGSWLEIILIAAPVVALIVRLFSPRTKMHISGRAIIFLILSSALGPGLLVNVVLKEHWGRPRPVHITQFGGHDHFVTWLDPRGKCSRNCSFVSGEASAAFWTIAPAALAPPPWRPLAYGAALTFGFAYSFLRIAAGGHFLSDTVFAGLFTFLVIWLLYALIYRWRNTRLNDKAIDDALDRLSAYCRDFVSKLPSPFRS